jgi:hypothetical protein
MFKNVITATPFTSSAADGFFQNINQSGNSFQSDVSFLATLRALVAPRITSEDSITLLYTSTNYAASNIQGAGNNAAIDAYVKNMHLNNRGMFVVHNFFHPNAEDNAVNMKMVEDNFTSRMQGYHRLDKMTDFFRKSFPVLCYINTELRNVVIFAERLDLKKLHYIQCSILAALPWYFNPDNGVAEIEMELIQSLRERTMDKYMDCLERIASQYDFKTARVKQLLNGFETRYERIECGKLRESIERTDNEITQINNSIGALLARRNDFCNKLLGLELKINQGGEESEIMEYFLCNNRLYLENVTNTDMFFVAGDYLSYFDKELVERMLNNTRSFVYISENGNAYSRIAPPKMVKLLGAIFIDETLRMKFCAAYRFSLSGGVSPLGNHQFTSEFNTFMPNPHINRYTCMGNYQRTINERLQQNDYIGALEQSIASCKSLNWADSTVMGGFMSLMYGNNSGCNTRCIELPDGSVVKPAQAIQWLEKQEEQNNAEAEEEA